MNKPMLNVLIISGAYYPPLGGGVATHVYYLTYALSQMRKRQVDRRRICNVHVLTTGESRRVRVGGKSPNLFIYRMPGEKGHFNPSGDVPFEEVIQYGFEHWSKIKPDVIHAHDFESVQIGLMFRASFKVPLIVTVHKTPKEWDPLLPQRNTKDCFLRAMQEHNIGDVFVAPSRAYEQALLDRGFAPDKIEVIPHGVAVGWLSALDSKDYVLQRLNLEDPHELILCPARLDRHKGLETFIEAASILKDRLPDRNLIFGIAGTGSSKYRRKLEQIAESLSIKTITRFGPSDNKDLDLREMPTLYRRAKVCVLPSRREGFGQALLEAFVFRVPVVGANTGGIPEVIESGVNGLLFNRDEPDDLAQQIQRLLEDDGLAKAFIRRASDRVRREFDADTMAKAYIKLYMKEARVTII